MTLSPSFQRFTPAPSADHLAGDLEPGNVGRALGRRIEALALHHVRPVDAGGGDLDQHLALGRLRHRPLFRHQHLRPAGARGWRSRSSGRAVRASETFLGELERRLVLGVRSTRVTTAAASTAIFRRTCDGGARCPQSTTTIARRRRSRTRSGRISRCFRSRSSTSASRCSGRRSRRLEAHRRQAGLAQRRRPFFKK